MAAHNQRTAFKADKHFYHEHDDETNAFGVFGTETGFCYALFCSANAAREAAQELDDRKNKAK